MQKKIMWSVIIAHALTIAWALFPTLDHVFIAGYPKGLPETWFVKGFCDCLLRLTYATVICIICRKHEPELAMFFYVTFWFYFFNLFFYWYNYCQWKWPFYFLMSGLVIAAVVIKPRGGKVVKM